MRYNTEVNKLGEMRL